MIAPRTSISCRTCGIAVISLDFASVGTCARVIPLSDIHTLTRCGGPGPLLSLRLPLSVFPSIALLESNWLHCTKNSTENVSRGESIRQVKKPAQELASCLSPIPDTGWPFSAAQDCRNSNRKNSHEDEIGDAENRPPCDDLGILDSLHPNH
jgi:hypothetical protein